VQAAEVDWALGNHARTLRARLALAAGDQAKGCRLARRVSDDWAHAEATLAATRAELAMMIRQHCRS
jgi:hypothetical protein